MNEPTSHPSDQDIENLLEAATAVHGVTIRPEWRAAALENLKVTAAAAKFVEEFPLDDELEPAPIFTA